MQGEEQFKKVIEAYLTKRASEDELFAVTFAKPNKNLDECVTYILNEVKSKNTCYMEDHLVYNMAVHYYDEDSIVVGSRPTGSVSSGDMPKAEKRAVTKKAKIEKPAVKSSAPKKAQQASQKAQKEREAKKAKAVKTTAPVIQGTLF